MKGIAPCIGPGRHKARSCRLFRGLWKSLKPKKVEWRKKQPLPGLKAVWFHCPQEAFCQLVTSNWFNSYNRYIVLYLTWLHFVSIFNERVYFSMISHAVYKIKRYKRGFSETRVCHPPPPPEVSFLCTEAFCACPSEYVYAPLEFPLFSMVAALPAFSPLAIILEMLQIGSYGTAILLYCRDQSVIWMNCHLWTSSSHTAATSSPNTLSTLGLSLSPGQSLKL